MKTEREKSPYQSWNKQVPIVGHDPRSDLFAMLTDNHHDRLVRPYKC